LAVDETSLERIRKATFPASRRGYDKREVEKFLNRLADWLETGGGDQARSDTVRRELERVGQRTGSILAEAEESAQEIRAEAEREARELAASSAAEADQTRKDAEAYAAEARATADGYSKETRTGADAYSEELRSSSEAQAQETRAKAEQDAHDMIEAAEAQARRTVDEGVQRRKDIESVIGDLAGRRDDVIADMETLSSSLSDSARHHKPPADNDPFDMPETLDPLERDGGPEAEEPTEIEDLSLEHEDETLLEPELEPEAQPMDEIDEPPKEAKPRSGRRKAKAASKSKS